MPENLFDGRSAPYSSPIPRPRIIAEIDNASNKLAWSNGGTLWTTSGTAGSITEDYLGARQQISSSTSEDDVALHYSARVALRYSGRGDGRRGTGSVLTAIFGSTANAKDIVVYQRAAVGGTPSGGEEANSWGVSRIKATDADNWYAFLKPASGDAVRVRLGAFSTSAVYMVAYEIVGRAIEISLYDLSDQGRRVGPVARFPNPNVATGSTRTVFSATTDAGGVAPSLGVGRVEYLPAFVG